MPPVNPMPFWLGISAMYLILTIGVFMTWFKLWKFHKEVETYTYLTKDGLAGGGIALGGDEEPRINVDNLFLKLVKVNLIALVISLFDAILTFTQAL